MKEIVESDFLLDHYPNRERLIIDPETYRHFRDEVFLKGILSFIEKCSPKDLNPGEYRDGKYYPPAERKGFIKQFHPVFPEDSDAAKVQKMFDLQRVISRHYAAFRKKTPKFYVHNGAVYSYAFYGFPTDQADIELLKYEAEDLAQMLNQFTKRISTKLVEWVRTFVG